MADEQKSEAPKEKVKLTILSLQQDLKDGLDRREIAKKYGLSQVDIKRAFNDPKLKNLKVRRKVEPAFVLIDDTVENAAQSTATAVTPAPEAAQQTVQETAPAVKEEPKEELKEIEQPPVDTSKGVW